MKKLIYLMATGAFALSTLAASAAEPKIPTCAGNDTDGIMSKAYWDLWNPEVQRKIDADIEANRKADACFTIGKIAKDSKVTVEQISHDFIFGAHFFNFNQLGDKSIDAKYRALYGTLFNSATISLYWTKFEMQPDRPRFAGEYWDSQNYWAAKDEPKQETHWRRPASDPVVEFCKSAGIRIHGHPMVWGNRSWQMPAWLFKACLTDKAEAEAFNDIVKSFAVEGNKSLPEKYTAVFSKMTSKDLSEKFPVFAKNLNKYFEKRVLDLANYYGDKIDSWDVVNESATDFKSKRFQNAKDCTLMKSGYGIMPADYTWKAFQTAQKVLPACAKLNINDYLMEQDYPNQIADLVSRGCKIDIVGSQMHLFNPKQTLAIAEGREYFYPKKKAGRLQTPNQVWEVMKLIDVGKPIHLSEITITAADTTPKGRMMQAIIARNLYRMWFSVKPMMGITWWNVVDDCGAPGEPSMSGLFTRGMAPKPAFYALNNLINGEWKTKEFTAVPDSDGNVKFRGFRGKYRVSWVDPDGKEKFKVFNLR